MGRTHLVAADKPRQGVALEGDGAIFGLLGLRRGTLQAQRNITVPLLVVNREPHAHGRGLGNQGRLIGTNLFKVSTFSKTPEMKTQRSDILGKAQSSLYESVCGALATSP
jgi:hypothetical protein